MGKQEFSIASLANKITTEADAYKLLETLRWTDGQPDVCPQCGVVGSRCYFLKPMDGSTGRKTRTGANSQRRVWKCGECRKQFSVLTGTIFHGTKIPIRTWLFVIFEFCAAKNSVSAREIERKYSLTPKSAWFMLHRIREATKREPLAALLGGAVQVDETWIGGNPTDALVGLLNGAITSLRFETEDSDFPVSKQQDNIVRGTPVTTTLGAIDGKVQTVSIRGSLRFTLYDTLNDRAVACYLSKGREDLVRGLWGHRAIVEGRILRDATTGRPLTIREITDVTELPDDETDSWRQAIGAVPAGPGTPLPEDAIRQIRDAW